MFVSPIEFGQYSEQSSPLYIIVLDFSLPFAFCNDASLCGAKTRPNVFYASKILVHTVTNAE